jgi:hypothetical protein
MQVAGLQISQETIASILQLGGQYALPAAALLRALYSGYRGKLPEGIGQILAASFFAGVTALADNQQPNFGQILLDLTGNTLFMAGLLSFIVVYLLRLPNKGLWLDGFVGALIGGIAGVIWVYVLNNLDGSIWTILLFIVAGAAAFIALRFALRQILKLVKIATWLIVIGIIFVVGAGGLFLLQQLMSAPPPAA